MMPSCRKKGDSRVAKKVRLDSMDELGKVLTEGAYELQGVEHGIAFQAVGGADGRLGSNKGKKPMHVA